MHDSFSELKFFNEIELEFESLLELCKIPLFSVVYLAPELQNENPRYSLKCGHLGTISKKMYSSISNILTVKCL